MIHRHTPLKRSSKPILKRRAKPRRGKLSPAKRAEVRHKVYVRSGGLCELKIRPDCLTRYNKTPLPETGSTPWDHWHACHIVSEARGGKFSETNLRGGCHKCHLLGEHRGERSPEDKPVPAKPKDWTQGYYGNAEAQQ